MTLFLGGLPRFLLNMASMLLVCVMLTGSALAPAAVEDMFHLRVYSWSLKWSSLLKGGSELRITSSQLSCRKVEVFSQKKDISGRASRDTRLQKVPLT